MRLLIKYNLMFCDMAYFADGKAWSTLFPFIHCLLTRRQIGKCSIPVTEGSFWSRQMSKGRITSSSRFSRIKPLEARWCMGCICSNGMNGREYWKRSVTRQSVVRLLKLRIEPSAYQREDGKMAQRVLKAYKQLSTWHFVRGVRGKMPIGEVLGDGADFVGVLATSSGIKFLQLHALHKTLEFYRKNNGSPGSENTGEVFPGKYGKICYV